MTGQTQHPLVDVTVDGTVHQLPEGVPLLQALRGVGISVPSLCNDVRLDQAIGNCGLCVVESGDGKRRAKACQTPVLAGLSLTTAADDVVAYRKLRLEQLLANHNADCVAPCQTTCPAGIDIQLYLKHVAVGNFEAALRVIKDSNPFPSVCGRVCPHPCEAACRRSLVDTPVGINAVKRFVADWDMDDGGGRRRPWMPQVSESTGRRVAVVGAGPSGLTCAYFLAQKGHSVTVFDKQPEAGGMLRYGIPSYRLPRPALDKEIAAITDLGVEVRTGQTLGVHYRLEDLRAEYDAVYLAFGSWQPTPLSIPGDSLPGVWLGVTFLEQVALAQSGAARAATTPVVPHVGDRVIVVGGGNTAIDCARTAIRLGAQVTLVYRRTAAEMPAEPHEVEDAAAEGVEMVFLAAPDHIALLPDGRKEMSCIRMELGAPDRSGRRRPVPVEGSNFGLVADTIIGAIGQRTNTQFLYTDVEIKLSSWGDIDACPTTSRTNQPGVFAWGDCVSGPSTVVAAVGAGKRAALNIDEYLATGGVTPAKAPYACSRGSLEDLPRHEFEARPRVTRAVPPRIDTERRTGTFDEVDAVIAMDVARAEAARCLECGCTARYDCALRNAATDHGVAFTKPLHQRPRFPVLDYHPFLIRDQNKCIACGKCIAACAEIEGVDVLGYRYGRALDGTGHLVVGAVDGVPLPETACVSCGQCAAVCPCGALDFRRESQAVWAALNDPNLTVVAFLAPAPRSVIADRYGWTPEEATPLVAGLARSLGFDKCFDLAFAADLTIVEEATEFLHRVSNQGVLPQFTSCCPGWVNFVEKKYPSLIPHLSTCRSPQGMMASTLRHHYARVAGVDPELLYIVSIMPCLAKKDEARRPALATDGHPDIDAVLTTEEFIEMVEAMRIDPRTVQPSSWDTPYARSSGAGVIFGASGGVAEAAMRMAIEQLTGETLAGDAVEFRDVRGFAGIREASVVAGGTELSVAVVAGLGVATPLIEAAARGETLPYSLIEIMACPGGCVGGAGNPPPSYHSEVRDRQQVLYDIDRAATLRKSQDNVDVWGLYSDLLGEPGSAEAHRLLHTTYTDRTARA